MRFNPKAQIDSSQVEVRSSGSSGSSSGGMFPFPTGGGAKMGGGLGLLVVIAFVLLSQCTGGGSTTSTGSGNDTVFPFPLPDAPAANAVDTAGVSGVPDCKTGEDANNNEECALVASINSIQAFWNTALPQFANVQYQSAKTVFFSGSTQTGCGGATAQVGPFYCPVDQTVYLDTTFFRDMLQNQLGAEGGEFAEAYVVGHEYGHHIQNLLGTMNKVRTQQGATSDSVRLELQADCYAGLWSRYATQVKDANGEVFIEDLTQDDVARAIDAAQAVGDDRIQKMSGGRVDPDQWTHGSAAAREYWFSQGYDTGQLTACDTKVGQSGVTAEDLHLDG
ncbi:MAG: neutral zinc metallopeptidase [Nocardioidaceae bacterium]